MPPKKLSILSTIIVAQFAGVSLWFAGNGVMEDLQQAFGLDAAALGDLTSAVQLGFIVGTLVFAIFAIADRFAAPRVFMFCALAGALANAAMVLPQNTFVTLIVLRATTGVFLAGIYPVGMKIAADHFPKGLGLALGFLLGALTLGTAFPHLGRAVLSEFEWESVIIAISANSRYRRPCAGACSS